MWIIALQRIFFECILDILFFPFWWYSYGLRRAFFGCYGFVQVGNITLAPGVWIKNIFVPMFGQYDWQGRLMSFFMRFVNIIYRSLAFFVVICFALFLFFCWVVFPVFVLYMLYFSFF